MRIKEVVIEGWWGKKQDNDTVKLPTQSSWQDIASKYGPGLEAYKQMQGQTAADARLTAAGMNPQGAMVSPGGRIKVTVPGSNHVYYKTAQGWYNEVNQKVTAPQSIQYLEQLADSGAGQEENVPMAPAKSRRPLRPGNRQPVQRTQLKGKPRVR